MAVFVNIVTFRIVLTGTKGCSLSAGRALSLLGASSACGVQMIHGIISPWSHLSRCSRRSLALPFQSTICFKNSFQVQQSFRKEPN
ncbi:hypothetical protein [Bacillus sp. JJ1609]|uniref:hypothetical protein n=1 Tax=Bacillus sp. JJ1609 TaxID=3122977 RepID=UPI002FFD6278